MKILRLLQLCLAIALIGFIASCGDDDDGTPNIIVGFSYTPTSPVAGETVSFTNASTGGSAFAWDFGDGNNATGNNPQHVYTAAGTYTVTLTVDDNSNLTFSNDVTVGAPAPIVTFEPDPIAIGVETTFSASIYNPTGAAVTFTWDFPESGWISEDLDANGSGTGESIMVVFTDANPSFPVKVTAAIGGANLERTVNVVVNTQLGKTLWIAAKGGNLWTKKLFAEGDAPLVDMEIGSGSNPLTLDFANDRVYVFDAGSQITFTSQTTNDVSGSIMSYSFNGTGAKTHVTFNSHPYNDAFFGSVINDGSTIIFADRNNDLTEIPEATENATWGADGAGANPAEFPALVINNQLAYYTAWANNIEGYDGPRFGFGALNGTIKKRGDVYWWAKNSNHRGLYRFTAADITVLDVIPSAGAILGNLGVRAFELDEENQKIYFSVNNPAESRGFYSCNFDGSAVTLIDGSASHSQGGENENVHITGIAIDNESGYVYWAYRGPTDADIEANPLLESGIKKFKLDGSGEVEYFISGVEAYGITLDNTKR